MSQTPAAPEKVVAELVADKAASRLLAMDSTLWGDEVAKEAVERLGWVEAPRRTRRLLPTLNTLCADLARDGLTEVILCGMGGNVLAAQVMCRAAGRPLTVLDTTHPDAVGRVLDRDLSTTVVVVSSKSGGTIETEALRSAAEAALQDQGLTPARHLVAVTDRGSDLARLAGRRAYRSVFAVEPDVGGRYSALTAFGIVPAALAGVDVAEILDVGGAALKTVGRDTPDNPALRLAVELGGGPGRGTLVLAEAGVPTGLSAWVEQLVAESTGKAGRGVLPLVVESPQAREVTTPQPDAVVAVLSGSAAELTGTTMLPDGGFATAGAPGAQFVLWEAATALAGRLLKVNPFDQPDVESAKAETRRMLADPPAPVAPSTVDGSVQVWATAGTGTGPGEEGQGSLESCLDALTGRPEDARYIGVLCYADPVRDSRLAEVRSLLSERTGRPVTFGWGPGYLHSTGQFHKGGAGPGAFIQITVPADRDVQIPEQPYSFRTLIEAQAGGDAALHRALGHPFLELRLADPQDGVDRLIRCLRGARA